MEATKQGEEYKITKICIDSYDDDVLNGRLYQYNPEFAEGIRFHSTMSFLKSVEYMTSKTAPQDYEAKRFFRKVEEIEIAKPSPSDFKHGKVATFVVTILFRQHASWQGSVLWCEEKKEEHFRSAMELLLLMDSAMSRKKTNSKGEE